VFRIDPEGLASLTTVQPLVDVAEAEDHVEAQHDAKQSNHAERKQLLAQENSYEAPERQQDETHPPHEPVERLAVKRYRAITEVLAHSRLPIGRSRPRTDAWASVPE
jgi:hypothetical protein